VSFRNDSLTGYLRMRSTYVRVPVGKLGGDFPDVVGQDFGFDDGDEYAPGEKPLS